VLLGRRPFGQPEVWRRGELPMVNEGSRLGQVKPAGGETWHGAANRGAELPQEITPNGRYDRWRAVAHWGETTARRPREAYLKRTAIVARRES
jgi:hypothetical protein